MIDGVNNDDEHCYNVDTAVRFHRMMNDMGLKTSIAPYMNKSFWSSLSTQLGSGICNLIMVQCYDGGAGNDPKDWHLNGAPVHGGRFHYQDESLSASHHAGVMQNWKNNSGATGGFFWVYNDNTWNLNQYATHVHRVFGVKTSSNTKATVYADANYGGYSVSLAEGSYSQSELSLYGFLGGDLSSLKVNPGYKITLYSNPDFTGDSKTWSSDAGSVGSDWNDRARSIRIEAGGTTGRSGIWKIRNRHSGKYLDLTNNSTDNDTPVVQFDEEIDDASQAWVFTEVGNGIYKICAYNNQNRGFDIHDASKENGAYLKIHDYVGGKNQQFMLVDKGDGWIQIIDRNSGKPIEMPNSTTGNGEWVKIYDNNGSDAQQWKLEDNRCGGVHVATVYADANYAGHSVALSEGDIRSTV